MKRHLATFASNEDGAVTVDWVVLTAGAAFLAVLVILPIATGSDSLLEIAAERIGSAPTEQDF